MSIAAESRRGVAATRPWRGTCRSRWQTGSLVLSVTMSALLLGCGGSPAPTAPSSPTPPTAPATLTGVTLTPATMAIRVGESLEVTARAQFSDGSSQEVTAQATWQSSNPTVLGIIAPGKALAMASGTADLRAAYQGMNSQVTVAVSPGPRAMADQPDDLGGPQVKVLYVVPVDRTDRQLDIDGTLARSVSAFQGWLRRESGGQQFRMDTSNGQLDIAMVRLAMTDAQVMSGGSRQRDLLERELIGRGFNAPGKIYAVYYDGGHRSTCADGFWPPALQGSVVAVYLYGAPPGARSCDTNRFTASVATPGYLEFSMAHEIFHGIGFVATCAPNHNGSGHVRDDPSDLMYAGAQPWTPSRLDTNRDDYFLHGRACADAAQSPYLTR